MKFSSFGYLVKQGWKSMSANRLMSLASIGVLTACLIITGIASLVSLNVNRVIDFFGTQNEIRVYLDDLTPESTTALEETIRNIENVKEVTYTSREGALAEMQEWMEDYSSLMNGYGAIFPASFTIVVNDLNLISQTNEQIKIMPGVESTETLTELTGILISLKTGVTYGGWGLVIILALVSIVIIGNTIRLTVFARRREISIMKYVGATNSFIRLPFFVEGMTVGAISGILGSGIVCGMYYLVMQYIQGSSNMWTSAIIANLMPLNSIWLYIVVCFVIFGVFVGGVGTANSIRKHLRV